MTLFMVYSIRKCFLCNYGVFFGIFSENYIFGKFDTFCRRLEKISVMNNQIEAYAGLGDVRLEGIEIYSNK